MVKAIDFVVRDSAGGVVRGAVAGDGGNFIQLGTGEEISLNLARQSVAGFQNRGGDLIITLIDGREIVLSGYFNQNGEPNQLYLSQNGEVIPVEFSDAGNGHLMASYGATDGWDKFSTLDDLRFGNGDDLALAQGAVSDEPAGMAAFVPGLLGLGTGAAAIAGIGVIGAVVGGGGGGGDGGGTPTRRPPTVDEPDSKHTVIIETADKTLDVSGTGEPGDKVTVTIGGETKETTIGEDGKWQVEFKEGDLPPDGSYETEVVFKQPDGKETTLDGPTFVIDLTPPAVEVTEGAKSTGDVENLEEYANGVTIGGEGEAGAKIEVKVGSYTQTTTVATDGTWSVTFPTTQIKGGEYEVPFTVTATDPAGNKTVVNETLVVDTVPNPITFNPVTSDNTVSGSEAASGFQITGRSIAGATLTVTVQNISQTVTVGADGSWSVNFAAGQLTGGEYTATIKATSTDAAGNVTNTTHSFKVDTTTFVAFAPAPIAGDGVVNASEAASGVTMTGTTQPGATVQVAWNGTTLPATVAADGSWRVTFPASGIAGGTYAATATVTATDAVGNTATATKAIKVDTEVVPLTQEGRIAGDGVVNATEAAAGVTIGGKVEAGAQSVILTLSNGKTIAATISGTSWTANLSAADLTDGSLTYTVKAVDAAGNTGTIGGNGSLGFTVDTEAPDALNTLKIVRDGQEVTGIYTSTNGEEVSIHQVNAVGQVSEIKHDVNEDISTTVNGAKVKADGYEFENGVPDGSYLVIGNADAAGNEAATLLIVDNTNTVTVDLHRAGLSDFNFSEIDLSFAPQATLTLTASDLDALTGTDKRLVINGGSDDTVKLDDATATGEFRTVDGERYAVYSLGDGTVLVDEDIKTSII